MKTYQYQVIKYVHDHFTGEFVNIGIIVYDYDSQYLNCKVTTRYKRISQFFPKADGKKVIQLLNYFERCINTRSKELKGFFKPTISLSDLTSSIIMKDNSVIQYSNVRTGIDIDLDAALNDLYNDVVDRYNEEKSKQQSLSDDEVWKTKYKQYFDNEGITNRLKNYTIKTKNDNFSFDKAWKNEIWHCYEPLSFDLQHKEAIKEKVYRWAGKIQGIKQTSEKVSITLLATLNMNFSDMRNFISQYLDVDSENVQIDIVFDEQASTLTKRIRQQIEAHDISHR